MVYQEILKEIQPELAYVEKELEKYSLYSDTVLADTSGHLLRGGGKRLRPALVILAARLFNYYRERIAPLAVAIELIHMATLVHDDVIDGSPTRRGIPTVNAKWGDPIALYTGDHLFAQALIIVARSAGETIARILAEVSLKMCEGEIEQIESAGKADEGLHAYLRRIKRKTALLISACCLAGALASDASPRQARSLRQYGYYVGMAFQITDDILDFVGSEKTFGKPVGSDLRQGIITLPVYYALRNRLTGRRLAGILAKKEKQEADWAEALKLVRSSGSLELARSCCNRYLSKARQELLELPDLPPRRALMELTGFIGGRNF